MGTLNRFTFTQAIKALGDAEVWISDNFAVSGGWRSLGAKEGAVTEAAAWTENVLTAPEHTGGIAHQATVVPASMAVTIPIIAGDPDLWALIEPTGQSYGFQSSPYDVVERAMLLLPRKEVPIAGGLTYTTPSGTTLVQNMTGGASTAPTPRTYPPNSAGNATFAAAASTTAHIGEQITLTFLTPTTFSVSGSASGAMGNGTLGTPFVSSPAGFNITVTAGATPQVAGDTFYWKLVPAAGTGWSPAAPINSIFFPRSYITHADVGRPYDNGGKSIVPVTIHPMWYAAGPANRNVYVRGDPIAQGYTTFQI